MKKKLLSSYDTPKKTHLVPCQCISESMMFLAFERLEQEIGQQDYEYAELYAHVYTHPKSIWERVKSAAKCLVGERLNDNGIVIGWEDMKRLRAYFDEIDAYWSELKKQDEEIKEHL